MEGLTGFGSSSCNAISRKPRSAASRRPRSTETLTATPHIESISSSPHYDTTNFAEGYKRKELYLNSISNSKKNKREERGRTGNTSGSGRSTEGALAPANWRGLAQQDEYTAVGSSAENKLRKVKLKVGGVTRTIHAKTDNESGEGSANRNKAKREYWFSNAGKGDTPEKYHTGSSSEPVRKSRRVPKRRSMDDDIEQDHEVRYLEKIRVSRAGAHPTTEFEDVADEGSKKHKVSKVTNSSNNNGNNKSGNRTSNYEVDEDFVVSRLGRDNNNRKKHKEVDGGFLEGEEAGSDGGLDAKLTSRQRAMQGKGGNGDSLIEFPNGLPPAPSRKQKEKLSEVEIQAKKAEAAQRRKMQVEKAAKEAEAEAIRKILGLDSDKKKEEKKQKEREEKEKAAKSQISASNTIKWVMGPTGTVVTFPDEVGLPNILSSKTSSYPPPREKCAGPSCTNPYKYRDSKSNLPLCSLLCYKAVQGSTNVNTLTC
ncbi:hypothetical protein LUZ61_007522 [Rhynchospora tenuis]|uniref:INO80 complex subunit B-like conserved region domain-containing protein n=1 Tax=Rhynchospora tenuis TaxID=198213 RepID=A0AAD5ZTJ7_9POAL|nr:hypothetical protein LUZ61_007522 [Rhynchospora tenuis]